MGYSDYEFYSKEYHGTMTEADFNKWITKASRQLDVITSRRLLSAYPDDEYSDRQIKMCVCEIAEKMADMETYIRAQAVREDGTAGVIQSKSAGSESISYATGESLYSNMAKNPKEFDRQLRNIAIRYLALIEGSDGICLLYRGL